ncbi:MAG TPA: twin-arginine translocation signal domain-containing protein, partial [Terriglobia bacterium]|nr:twin-arginine translocation signal domain-containing protein [Terriglobia bacterium]
MKTTRRKFLQTSAAVTAAGLIPKPGVGAEQTSALRAEEIARKHPIIRDVPGPSFFEGMLLGNGDVGVCAVVRPDALGLHLGKSDVWDIRVSEESFQHVLPFPEL